MNFWEAIYKAVRQFDFGRYLRLKFKPVADCIDDFLFEFSSSKINRESFGDVPQLRNCIVV